MAKNMDVKAGMGMKAEMDTILGFIDLGVSGYLLVDSHRSSLICSVDSPLEWNPRMKITARAAEGLGYLHNKAEPSVIYRDLKSANILLDERFYTRHSDFCLANFGPDCDKSHVSTRVMRSQRYRAPEYAVTVELTKMFDIFSFGVVLLDLITGKQAIDPRRRMENFCMLIGFCWRFTCIQIRKETWKGGFGQVYVGRLASSGSQRRLCLLVII